MAQRRREEWSCSVCTLLNHWRDRRCAACDNECPEGAENQPLDWTCSLCTLVNEWSETRCVACEHDRPPNDSQAEPQSSTPRGSESPGNMRMPREEGSRIQSRSNGKRELSRSHSDSLDLDSPKPSHEHSSAIVVVTRIDSPRPSAEVPDPEDFPEAPKFDLLVFGDAESSLPNYSAAERTRQNQDVSQQSVQPQHDAIDLTGSAQCEHNADLLLAKAGLDLDSNSDGESTSSRRVTRLKRLKHVSVPMANYYEEALSTENCSEWECAVCTNLNPNDLDRCDLCDTAKKSANIATVSAGNTRSFDPHDISHTSSPNLRMHRMNKLRLDSGSTVSSVATACSTSPRQPTFTCLVCTSINSEHLDQCALCGVKRRCVRCPVCTSENDQVLRNCEVCETPLVDNGPDFRWENTGDKNIHRAAESSFHSPRGSRSVDHDSADDEDVDFEDGYADHHIPTASRRMVDEPLSTADFNSVEDISDGEPFSGTPAEKQLLARSKQSELEEFLHFLPVEEIKSDYGCQIDYRAMFAESSRSRSYSDRLQKRRRESQKRRRSMSEKSASSLHSGDNTDGKKKTAKRPSKKATTSERRASTGQVTGKGKKKSARGQTRKTGTARRSSAPQYASGVDHYSTFDGDIGDDVTMMAWEGVGSAGYF